MKKAIIAIIAAVVIAVTILGILFVGSFIAIMYIPPQVVADVYGPNDPICDVHRTIADIRPGQAKGFDATYPITATFDISDGSDSGRLRMSLYGDRSVRVDVDGAPGEDGITWSRTGHTSSSSSYSIGARGEYLTMEILSTGTATIYKDGESFRGSWR